MFGAGGDLYGWTPPAEPVKLQTKSGEDVLALAFLGEQRLVVARGGPVLHDVNELQVLRRSSPLRWEQEARAVLREKPACLAVDPDRELLALGGASGGVRLFSADGLEDRGTLSGQHHVDPIAGPVAHLGRVTCLRFSADGRVVYTGSGSDGSVGKGTFGKRSEISSWRVSDRKQLDCRALGRDPQDDEIGLRYLADFDAYGPADEVLLLVFRGQTGGVKGQQIELWWRDALFPNAKAQ